MNHAQTLLDFKKRIVQLEKLRISLDEQALMYINKRKECRLEIADIKCKIKELSRKNKENKRFEGVAPRTTTVVINEKYAKRHTTLSEEVYGKGNRIICNDCRDIFEIQAILYLEQINPTLADVVSLYFGYDRGFPRTLKTTAQLILKLTCARTSKVGWGVTQEVVRQRLGKAYRILRYSKRTKHLKKWVNGINES